MCLKPIIVNNGVDTVGCGQCLRCRMRRRSCWVGRMVLEAARYPVSTVRTLTYAGESFASELHYEHVQTYIRRLRDGGARFRYFVCGEHGDMFNRAHWHMILFGLAPVSVRRRYESVDWPYGLVFDDVMSVSACRYITGYVFKNDKRDKTLSRMSLKPGIGLDTLRSLGHNAAGGPLAAWPRMMVVQGKKYAVTGGALAAFKEGFLNSGGSPPVERTQIERRAASIALYCDWGTRIEQKRQWNTEWLLRRGELLAPSYTQ